MENRKRVTVIGGANLDIVAGYQSGESQYNDSSSGKISTYPGGVARNIAENLARLGITTNLITALGDDGFSKQIIDSVDLPFLDTSCCHFIDQSRADTYLSVLDHHGELLHAINQMQLVETLTADVVLKHQDIINQSDLIIADCNLPMASIESLISLDHRPALFFDGVSSEKIMKLKNLLGQFEGLKCNQIEAALLTDQDPLPDPEELMHALIGYDIQTILLSLGADGVLFRHQDGKVQHLKPDPSDRIISVSGAGDALFSGYIFGIITGMSEAESQALANKAACLTLQYPGAVHPEIACILNGSIVAS